MRILKTVALLFCLTAWSFAAPKTLTTSVAFTDPQNNVLANGYLVFQLSAGANVIGGGQVVQSVPIKISLTAGGLISGSPTIWANDQLQPTGTYYIVKIYNANNTLVRGPENWILSGASPIDLALETNVNLPDPGLGQPVLQNPSAAQTITGQPLTISSSALLTVQNNAVFTGLPTFANSSSSQSVTLTPLAAAGSTATAVCGSGWTCTPDYGQFTLTPSGSGITTGDNVSITWSTAGDHIRVCVMNAYDNTASATVTTILQDGTAANNSTTKIAVFVSSALTTAHAYNIYYVCR